MIMSRRTVNNLNWSRAVVLACLGVALLPVLVRAQQPTPDKDDKPMDPNTKPAKAALQGDLMSGTWKIVSADRNGKSVADEPVEVIAALVDGMGLIYTTAAAQGDKKPPAGKPMEPAANKDKDKDKEGFTAWGKEVNGLQAGLAFLPGEHRAYRHGETVTLVVRVRNVGKKEVEFQYLKEFFKENPPIVTDADGKKLPGYKILYLPEEHVPEKVSLPPGQEIELSSEEYQLMPTNEREKGHSGRFSPLWVGTGKVSVQYYRLFGNTSAGRIKVDPDLLKLATGKLELEIKADPQFKFKVDTQEEKKDVGGNQKPTAGKPMEPAAKQEKKEEAFTAWGKEVDGLQAGLGFLPGEHRAYRHGETVTLVVRVRNVGTQPVKFEYIGQFWDENWPIVRDADGKAIPQPGGSGGLLGIHVPIEVTVEPGKEIGFKSRSHLEAGQKYVLQPADGGVERKTEGRPLRVGTGKVSVQYEQVFGNSSSGRIKVDPDLLKLSTGKLELEITVDPQVKPDPQEEKKD